MSERDGRRAVDVGSAAEEAAFIQRAIRADAGLAGLVTEIEDVGEMRPAARSALARSLSSWVTS